MIKTNKKSQQPKEKQYCLNCGEELTNLEAIYGEGWCDSCNLPDGDVYA